MNSMKQWVKAFAEQIAVGLVQVKSWKFWPPLLIGLILGLFIGGLTVPAQSSTASSSSQSLTSGWPSIISSALLGVMFALFFGWLSKISAQITVRRPLNKVLGPLVGDLVTIYVAPFKRPLDSSLFRLDPTPSSIESTPVVGTERVVGWCDTLALSFIYATLLKAGKAPATILINQNPTLDYDRWGKSIVCIGAANAKTRAVLESFHNARFAFDDDSSSIVIRPAPSEVEKTIIIDEREITVRHLLKVRRRPGKDYGIILKLKDEVLDEHNRVFIVAGLGEDGTAGAAFYLWRHYERLATKEDPFGVLIETTSAGYESAKEVVFDSVAILVPVISR
jgi:hypothetical protein